MKRRLLSGFVMAAMLFPAYLTARAVGAELGNGIFNAVVEHDNNVRQMRNYLYDKPSLHVFRSSFSVNALNLSYLHRSATVAPRPEQGDGENTLNIAISSYLKSKNNKLDSLTLWGAANYSKSRIDNIQYSETNDYDMVRPYVVADVVGGWLKSERYNFSGGVGATRPTPAGNSLTYAIEGEYTATLSYRTTDPRPNNISSLLRINGGINLTAGRQFYAIDLSLSKYKQTNNIKIYDQVSAPTLYHLTGAGNDYYRFRGDNGSNYYKGKMFGCALTYGQVDICGLYASAAFGHTDIDKIITSLNQLPLATVVANTGKVCVGYSTASNRHEWGVSLSSEIDSRNGTENIFGNAQDNVFPQIAKQKLYRDNHIKANAEFAYLYHYGKGNYHTNIGLGGYKHEEKYLSLQPMRFSNNGISAYAEMGVRHIARRMMYSLTAKTLFDLNLNHETTGRKLDYNTDEVFGAWLWRNDYYANNRADVITSASAEYDTSRNLSVFVALEYHYEHYSAAQHQNSYTVSVGCHF